MTSEITTPLTRENIEAGAIAYTYKYSYVTAIVRAQLNDFGVVVVDYVGPSAARDAQGEPIQARFTRYVDRNEAISML